jgi:hypothetical protein
LVIAFPIVSNADSNDSSISIEQIRAKKPNIRADVFLPKGVDKESLTVTIGDSPEPLKIDELIPYKDSDVSTKYVFLVDISNSLDKAQLDKVKESLNSFSKSLNEKDEIVLIPVGEKEPQASLSGGESEKERTEIINSLTNIDGQTLLYDAINVALSITDGYLGDINKREVIVAISDGENWNKGGHVTFEKIKDSLSNGYIPLYALGLAGAKKTDLDNFALLATESDGIAATESDSSIKQAFDNIITRIESSSVLYLDAGDNLIVKKPQEFHIEVDYEGKILSDYKSFTSLSADDDKEAPKVVGDPEPLEEPDGIRIRFSEPILNGNDSSSYEIYNKGGDVLDIMPTYYSDGSYVDIVFENKPFNGKYTVKFPGITDKSNEKNPMTEKIEFKYTDGKSAFWKILDFWWVILIVVILALAFIAYRIIRKRKGIIKVNGEIGFGDMAEYKHHFDTPDLNTVSLIVTDTKGDSKKVDVEIVNSIFVGRSDINNLSFDDDKLSRQHFVIEEVRGTYFISDLNTTNGTFLNGVPLKAKRELKDNDVITAGREKFIFRSNG